MQTHVKVLGVLYIAVSALSLLGAVFLLLAVGGAAAIVGAAAEPGDAVIALPIIGIGGAALAAMLIILALPGLVTGWGLLQYRPWARVLGLVLSLLNLLNVPFGTVLGIYGLWVLLNGETEKLFSRSSGTTTAA
jgi:hypothetical protein